MASPDFYFRRFGFCGRQIAEPPHPGLGIIVVIPCLNEPDLIGSLESLWSCEPSNCPAEVIVVINSPAGCCETIRVQNLKTWEEASRWSREHSTPRLVFHVLHVPDLPPKQAGVGLARKIGMDEAVRRFDDIGRTTGIVVCYDADCRCEGNYLRSIERHFEKNPRTPGCSIYFEHPLDGPLDAKVYEAVAAYELHLRYYVHALRYAGFPYAHQTIGSSMAVRADVYKEQGGMNKRRAGEDFYFLQKIIPLGAFTELTDTTVNPSSRGSDRVPFGTGRAVRAHLAGNKISTYPLEAFLDLKVLCERLPAADYGEQLLRSDMCDGLPESMRTFLRAQRFTEALAEIRDNTSTPAAFRARFLRWFNGFQAMKFIHHARDDYYGERGIEDEAGRLLELLSGRVGKVGGSTLELLLAYRRLDRR
ncbi:MAG: hypothetical protein ABI651_20875 [Verrucomicrobiota bacterium]